MKKIACSPWCEGCKHGVGEGERTVCSQFRDPEHEWRGVGSKSRDEKITRGCGSYEIAYPSYEDLPDKLIDALSLMAISDPQRAPRGYKATR